MNWSMAGAIGEILGAVAVVFSLLYLSAQVRAATKQSQHAAARDLAEGVSNLSLTIASDRDLALVWVTGAGEEDMDSVDLARFRFICNSIFRTFEQQFLLHQEGGLNEESWAGCEYMMDELANLPGIQQYLADRGKWYAPSFQAYLHQQQETTREGVSLRSHYLPGPDRPPKADPALG
jgi:hypothetical protein